MLDPSQARRQGATRGRASTTLILVEAVARDALAAASRLCRRFYVALQC